MSGQRRTGTDGSAGDVDYGALEAEYARYRRPDPSIMAHIEQALGPARTIVNVGAGAGSYEPSDRTVTPVEPSAAMRVATGPVVVLTCDPVVMADYWLNDYAPGVRANEARRFPPIDRIVGVLGPATRVEHVPIPLDCRDGFNEAYYGRPEMFLDRAARLACSSWSFLTDEETAQFETRLAADLASGAWDRRYGHWRKEPFYDGPLRLVIG